MEAVPISTAVTDSWSEEFTAALMAQRARTREFLAAQETRLRRAEATLNAELRRIGEETAGTQFENRQIQEDLNTRTESLRQQTAALEQLKAEMTERQSAWEKLQQQAQAQWQAWQQQLARCEEDFEHRRSQWERTASAEQVELQRLLDQRSQRIEELESELQTARQEARDRAAEAEQFRHRCRQAEEEITRSRASGENTSEDSGRLRAERDELAGRLEEVQTQLAAAASRAVAAETAAQAEKENYQRRYQMAKEDLDARSEVLRQQTAALEQFNAELAERQSVWEKLQQQAQTQWQTWQQQLARGEEDFERRRSLCEHAASAEQTELQQLLEQQRQRIGQLESEIQMARQAADDRAAVKGASEDNSRLRAERDELASRLKEVQSQLAYATSQLAAVETGDQGNEESYQRRYQMALEDLKELKTKNDELEQELAKSRAAPAAGDKFRNWELEKQQILAAMEADFDEKSEEDLQQRLKIEEVIRKTDTLLADKDREIGELRNLLENQSGNLGTVAVGAAALGEVLDQDTLVREAREDLKRLQEQLREKMRQAEVEFSIERAKIARQRQELEERTRFLENYTPPEPTAAPTPQKSTRGRWLERLGLKEGEK